MDIKFNYTDNGFGDILILLHGNGEAPFTIVQFAEDLHDFMDEKGIDKAHILGFSDGGNIALNFALKYQERVEKSF